MQTSVCVCCADAPGVLFAGQVYEADLEKAWGCWRHLKTMFQELEECRAFELLKVHPEAGLETVSRCAGNVLRVWGLGLDIDLGCDVSAMKTAMTYQL